MPDILGPANADHAVTTRPADSRTFSTLDTWFQDCSNPNVEDGTEIQASFNNGILAALRSLWRGNGSLAVGGAKVVPEVGSDDHGLTKSVQHMIQRGQMSFAVDTGTANALAITLSPAPPELIAGLLVRVKAAHATTGAATIDVNGLGAVAIKHPDGTALGVDDIVAAGVAEMVFDGAVFQLVASHTDAVGGGGGVGFRVPYAVATGTASAIAADYSPDTATPVAGDLMSVKLASNIAGATTFSPDGHGPYALKDMNGAALFANFAIAGDLLLMEFDGTDFRVLNRLPGSSPNFMTPGAIGSLGLAFADINGYYPIADHDIVRQPSLGYVFGNYVYNIAGATAGWPTGTATPLFTGTWRILSAFSLDSIITTAYPRVPILLCQRIA